MEDINVVGNVKSTEVAPVKERLDIQREVLGFEKLMEMATMLSKSTIVPVMYQNRPENCFIALDMASRMGISPMVIMQNLYIVLGKPSFSGSAMASMLRASKEFSNVELNFVGEEGRDTWGAYVSAIRRGKTIKGATVTIAIAKREGWLSKTGSKWLTMPELMLGYRANAWFVRTHCPELLMGMQVSDEVEDVYTEKVKATNPYEEVKK